MILLSRRSVLAIVAVVDVALNARPMPVAAKQIASRHDLPPRHLETMLQALVKANILKGVRGPRGGYELARERRRITCADIVRAAMEATGEIAAPPMPESALVTEIIGPLIGRAGESFLAALDKITVEDLCASADRQVMVASADNFTI